MAMDYKGCPKTLWDQVYSAIPWVNTNTCYHMGMGLLRLDFRLSVCKLCVFRFKVHILKTTEANPTKTTSTVYGSRVCQHKSW